MIVLILQLTADRLHVTKSIRSLEPGTNYFSNLKLKLEFEQMGGIVSASTAKKSKSLSATLEPSKEAACLVQDTSLNLLQMYYFTPENLLHFLELKIPIVLENCQNFHLHPHFTERLKCSNFLIHEILQAVLVQTGPL